MLEIDKIYEGDCLNLMPEIDSNSIDLTVTSPPYDNLRTYNGYKFDFEPIAKELYRITKPGGVVVWVVGDATINGSETGTSFRQALGFMDIGFKLHDTMIYNKHAVLPMFPGSHRYNHSFEYMFVLSKDGPKKFNALKEPKIDIKKRSEDTIHTRIGKDQKRNIKRSLGAEKLRSNVWTYKTGFGQTTSDKQAFQHPAIFPEQLASDHIISWSNPGDLILDPMCGSGTTCKMAAKNDRHFIGIDVSGEYCEIARKRIASIPTKSTAF